MNPEDQKWLRTSEAAEVLNVSTRTLDRWTKAGIISHRKTLGGHSRYDPELMAQMAVVIANRRKDGRARLLFAEDNPQSINGRFPAPAPNWEDQRR